jgi:hypothetical protein
MAAWQTDPELQRLRQAVLAESRVSPIGKATGAPSQAMRAYMNYINQRGPSLGVPSGYTIDPDTNQLKKDDPIPWAKIGITSGALLGGAIAAPALMGAGGSAAGGASASGASGASAAAAEGPGSFAAPVAGGATPLGGVAPVAAGGAGNSILDWLKDPKNLAGLATTIPAIAGLTGNGGSQNGPMDDPTVQQLLQMNLKRQQRTDPLHESVTQLAMGMMPTAYQRK